jgi:8-oxo-dGTP pyrophosphatase MutT (NUDIX family)
MNNMLYASINKFLQQQTVVSLVPEAALRLSPDRFLKASVVPFIRRAGLEYYVMKPRAARPELAPPEFQLCKGTRKHFMDGLGWCDMKEGQPGEGQRETLLETALREGVEELGLELMNIVSVFELGPYSFQSATTKKSKQMWVFAVEVIDGSDFLDASRIEPTTAERGWMRPDVFAAEGRSDHRPVLADVHEKLVKRYK